MPWNGSGVFNRIYSWVADKNGGLDIIASRMDTDTDDITSNGFGNCVTRDGQGQPNASLIPLVSATYDLGSVSFQWRNAWFTGNLVVGGTGAITGNITIGGTLTVNGVGTSSFGGPLQNTTGNFTCTNGNIVSGNNVSATGFNVLNTMSWQGMVLSGAGLPANFDVIAGTNGVRLPANGTAWTALSSAEYKKAIQDIPGSALARCAKLKGQLFLYNEEPDGAPLRAGLIYEAVIDPDAFPWAAHYSPERTLSQTVKDADGSESVETHTQAESKTISLEQHVPLLIDAVNELHAQLDVATARIAALEAKAS